MPTDNEANAVSLKLPDFWKKSPEVWFARVEAQFSTKQITSDQTKYDYIVSILDIDTADEMQSILIHPPNDDKYNTLKNALINIYGKYQLQKDFELLSPDGLGDRRPSALMRKIEALNDDPKTLKRALFLANLPSDIRTILLSHNPTEMKDLATTADQIWEAQRTSLQHTTSVTNVPQYNALDVPTSTSTYLQAAAPTVETAVSQRPARKKQPFSKNGNGSTNTAATICFCHTKFGPDARRC